MRGRCTTRQAPPGSNTEVFYTTRWLPPEQYLAELIRDGFVGRLLHCDLRFFGAYALSSEYQWRFDRRRANGAVADLGSHMIDLALWYVGEIEKVTAHLMTFVQRGGAGDEPLEPANDSASVLLQFQNGAQGMLYLSGLAYAAERQFQYQYILHGEGGTLEADLSPAGTEIRGARREDKEFRVLPVPDRLWGDSVPGERFGAFNKNSAGGRAFIDAILEDRPFAPGFYDGWKAQQVIDAALESDRTGCWVPVR